MTKLIDIEDYVEEGNVVIGGRNDEIAKEQGCQEDAEIVELMEETTGTKNEIAIEN